MIYKVQLGMGLYNMWKKCKLYNNDFSLQVGVKDLFFVFDMISPLNQQ